MSGVASRGSKRDALLRVSQACETLLAGFHSGQAAALKSCLTSRQHAMSVSQRNEKEEHVTFSQDHRNLLFPLEDAMAHRRTRPSFLLPAWRAVGFAVGTSATVLLPVESSVKVGAAITRAVTDQYDASIRSMYEARIEEAESEVKGLFKAQRDEPSRASLALDSSSSGDDPSDFAGGTGSMAVTGTLKSALRVACDVTAKI